LQHLMVSVCQVDIFRFVIYSQGTGLINTSFEREKNMTENTQEPSGIPISMSPPPVSQNEKLWATICHLAGFALLIVYLPFSNIIAPLIVWLIKKDTSEFVRDQGREALNFQITMTICLLVAVALAFILIGIPLLVALLIFDIVMRIKAADRVSRSERYRYPFTFRFIK